MDSNEIDDMLPSVGTGVLSLCAEGVLYGVALSFGYNGNKWLYFYSLVARVPNSGKNRMSNRPVSQVLLSMISSLTGLDGVSSLLDRLIKSRLMSGIPHARRWPIMRTNLSSSRSTNFRRTPMCGHLRSKITLAVLSANSRCFA